MQTTQDAAAPITTDYLPVSGQVDASGRLLDFVGIVNSSQAPLITPPSPPAWSDLNDPVSMWIDATGELTARLGFGAGQASVDASAVYKLYDLLQTKDVPNTDGPIASWVFGVGMRISLSTLNASADVTASYAGIAAAVTLGTAEASFEFQTIGFGFDVLPAIRGLVLQAMKGFDAGTAEALGDAWFQVVTLMQSQDQAAFNPRLVGVRLSEYDGLKSIGGSYGFALRSVRDGFKGSDAVNQTSNFPPNTSLDKTIVQDLYAALVGSQDTAPNDQMKAIAAQLDDSG